jgi:hypothetical protein
MSEVLDISNSLLLQIEKVVAAKFPKQVIGYRQQYNQKYYLEHKDKLRAHQSSAYHNNIEKARKYYQEYRAKKKQQKEE